MTGKVTLVGAGPGDGGLITLKGRDALLSAEVVVYDRLVGDEILEMIPEDAQRIDAGKESSNHKIPQSEINRILCDKALEGKNVVRLKGGDCYLFGRGGEELELLYENNIPFEVVPGITSALAVPAYAGIPVTHRDFASSVHIITAHARDGKELDIDFKAYRKTGGTLVFLMGVANMQYITDGLTEAGFDALTPCAVIERGTTAEQKKYIGTLSDITDKARDAKSPSVIVVGDVCGLSDKYDRFSNRPLSGVTVTVTRPKERMGMLSDKLRKKGAKVIECPCIRTKSLMSRERTEETAMEICRHDRIVFTSPSGVKSVMDGLYNIGLDVRVFGGTQIAVIGSATAAELEKYGLKADLMPASYDGAGLGEVIIKDVKPGEKLLLLRARDSNKTLNRMFNENGIIYDELAVYETEEYCEGRAEECDYVTFTSASTVRGFIKGYKNMDKTGFVAVCMGKNAAAEADSFGLRYIVSPQNTIDSLVKAIEDNRWQNI